MPEPSASPNTPDNNEGDPPVSYFEFRPFKESPPQPRPQPITKTQRVQPQAPIVSSGQQAKSAARQNTPSIPHQVPGDKQQDSSSTGGAAKNRQQPSTEGQRQPSAGQQHNGVVSSETARAKLLPTSSSSTSLEGSAAVLQQQAKKASDKPVSKISVSSS